MSIWSGQVFLFLYKIALLQCSQISDISEASQTSDQISDDYWWKGGTLDLNNLQRIQTETKYLSTLSVGGEMKGEMT